MKRFFVNGPVDYCGEGDKFGFGPTFPFLKIPFSSLVVIRVSDVHGVIFNFSRSIRGSETDSVFISDKGFKH